jgi:hypothetical protein
MGFATAAHALTKDEYIVAADNICRQAEELRTEVASAAFAGLEEGAEPTFDQLAEYVAGSEPVSRQEIDSLRALEPPEGDEKKLNKLYNKYEKALDKIVDDPNKLLSNLLFKVSKGAAKYGFQECGQG